MQLWIPAGRIAFLLYPKVSCTGSSDCIAGRRIRAAKLSAAKLFYALLFFCFLFNHPVGQINFMATWSPDSPHRKWDVSFRWQGSVTSDYLQSEIALLLIVSTKQGGNYNHQGWCRLCHTLYTYLRTPDLHFILKPCENTLTSFKNNLFFHGKSTSPLLILKYLLLSREVNGNTHKIRIIIYNFTTILCYFSLCARLGKVRPF